MGYTTEFTGILKISPELKESELLYLLKYFGEDVRDHIEWHTNEFARNLDYIDLRLSDNLQGIEWNDESEKTYEMVDQVNFIITEMKKILHSFELSGELLAQGEEIYDRWKLIIKDGFAQRVDIISEEKKVKCPHCEGWFFLTKEK